MTSTVFVDKTTLIEASWLNDVNAKTYADPVPVALAASSGSSLVGHLAGSTPTTVADELNSLVTAVAELVPGVPVYATPPAVAPIDTLYLVLSAGVDTTAPTVTAFTATGTHSPITITSFTATDNVAVTGYWVGTSATEPSLGDAGWSASPQTSFTTGSTGSVTLYARARDAAGNISAASTVVLTLGATSSTDYGIYDPAVYTTWATLRRGSAVPNYTGAQSFTATVSGTFVQVTITVRSRKDTYFGTGDLQITLLKGATMAVATSLGSTTLTNFTTSGNAYEQRTAVFSASEALVSGTLYWIMFAITSPSGDVVYQIPMGATSTVANGDGQYQTATGSDPSGSAWISYAADMPITIVTVA